MKTKHILLATGLSLAAFTQAVASPTIITQPQGRSVDRGVEVVFSVTAVSALPITYQWRKGANDLQDETFDILFFASAQTTDAGNYTVVVSDTSGSVTSQVAALTVDAAFTKITTGAIVNDGGASLGASWADYDNDGWLDLFVANTLSQNDFLYHNNGDGTFARITNSPVANDGVNSVGATWGDYDNDGAQDLFVATPGNNLLYRNQGDGTFTRITDSIVASDGGSSSSPSWADYDNDGDLDLYVSNNPGPKFLYRNDGNGTFTKVTTGILATDPGNFAGSTWGDYDNDSDLDLFVSGAGNLSVLYRNDGGGTFTKITNGILVNEGTGGFGSAWGDYDNDGWLDLFVCVGGTVGPATSLLYHNNGDGTFTKITNGAIVTDSGNWLRAAWGDYDNDSFLDLFVSNLAGNNALYHNNGDGTFTKVTAGTVVNDGGQSAGCGWGDYDNDGFLDLFVANGRTTGNENNFLYHNNGNTNSWIKLRLVGDGSNRYGVGAKIKVNAVIGGTNRWLTRPIDGSDVNGNASALVVGLGDATNVSTLRVEWPSGTIQELHGLPVKQALTLFEAAVRPPVFLTQPQSQLVLTHSNATLQPLVTSVTPLTYQWLKDAVPIPNATNSSLALTNAQLSDSGSYVLAANNDVGETTSQPAVLSVAPFFITSHPTNQTVRAGSNATFTAAVLSGAPVVLQWRLNGMNLPGETSPTLLITDAQPQHAGEYLALVSDGLWFATSRVARLTVLVLPQMVQPVPPLNLTVVQGGDITVSVTVSNTATLPVYFRWRRGTTTLNPTPLAVNGYTAFFTLTNVQPPTSGVQTNITVVITNLASAGAILLRTNAYLTVLADTDHDGLPDLWEAQFGLNPNDVTDAAQDADGDTMSNGQEYLAGTNPTNALSYLKIESITKPDGASAAVLRFFVVSNKTYTVEWRGAADTGSWSRVADIVALATNRLVEITDASASPTNAQSYYRLVTPRRP